MKIPVRLRDKIHVVKILQEIQEEISHYLFTVACINAGLYAIGPRILELIRPGPLDFGRDVWPAALASGEVLRGFELDCCVYDIGSPEALRAVDRAVVEGALRCRVSAGD